MSNLSNLDTSAIANMSESDKRELATFMQSEQQKAGIQESSSY